MTRAYTQAEIKADGIVHAAGLMFCVPAAIALFVAALHTMPAKASFSVAIYGVGLIAMLSFSAAYHMIPAPDLKSLLRRLDQAAIFIKIAGTYTPFALFKMGGLAGYGLLGVVWAVALAGALGKLALDKTWDRLSIALYLALGWAGLAVIQPLVMAVPTISMFLLALGGVLYSVGVIFHVWNRLPYQNAIWHLFVLAATLCHFGAVAFAIFA
jgi:hemolysin III